MWFLLTGTFIWFQVTVKYIGKLQKDGKIFDSNVGRAPFKFRLGMYCVMCWICWDISFFIILHLLHFVFAGVGQVIKGWEVGINGNISFISRLTFFNKSLCHLMLFFILTVFFSRQEWGLGTKEGSQFHHLWGMKFPFNHLFVEFDISK